MRLGRDLLVLGFGDLAAPSAPQLQTLTAVAPPDATCVLVDADWPAADGAQLGALAALAQSKPWLICVGVGAGGYGALYFGRMLGASAIFAAAPGAGHGRPIGVEDLDDLAALYADPDLRTPDQLLQVVTADDSLALDLALLDRLRVVGAEVAVDHAALPSAAATLALAQSGVWTEQLAAWLARAPIPDAGDVAARWRQAFAHTLEIDIAATYQDVGGAMHLFGRLLNRSPAAFDLAMASAERVRIGARLRRSKSGDSIIQEVRASFAACMLGPGQTTSFRLSLADFKAEVGLLELALVCDGRFWFDQVGFEHLTLEIGAPSSKAQTAELAASETQASDLAMAKPEPPAPVFLESSSMAAPTRLDAYKAQCSGPHATLDDLWNCYRLLLNREPDVGGFEGYAAIVERGLGVDGLVRMFVSSPEYARLVQAPADPTITLAHLDGFDLYVPSADAVVSEEILKHGTYEPHVTTALSAVLRASQAVVDIGANVGYFTVLAARAVGPTGQVFAFEPLPRNFKLLLANVQINKAANTILRPFGAGEREGVVTLLSTGSIASSREAQTDDLTTANAFEFAYVQRIDDAIPAVRPIDVLKIDIDGFDHRAMLGAQASLTRSHPHVFAEFAPPLLAEFSGIDPIEYLKFYQTCGYNDFTVLLREGDPLAVGADINRIARMPAELGATHIDLHIQRL